MLEAASHFANHVRRVDRQIVVKDLVRIDGVASELLDFADFDASVATNVPGQSGQPGSEYYDNLLSLWAQGRYFPLPFSRGAVERATAHVLTLAPAPIVGMTAPSH